MFDWTVAVLACFNYLFCLEKKVVAEQIDTTRSPLSNSLKACSLCFVLIKSRNYLGMTRPSEHLSSLLLKVAVLLKTLS